MSQTSYTDTRAKAVPGLLYGNPADNYVVGDFISNEVLEPGRLVVKDSNGKIKVPANSGAAALSEQVVGVVAFQPTSMQTAIPAAGFTYPAGVKVPVLRKGRIWMQVDSTAEPTALAALNVHHPSTTATKRGKATTNATSATADAEIGNVAQMQFVEKASTTLWCVELNLP